jgi:D-alanyl-lipoteichoic acid acyltransferase DltB (MBOAT superfamily)
VGIAIDNTIGKGRKPLLFISLLSNLGILGLFKYYNFFARELQEGFAYIGYDIDSLSLDIILPVGISFYTFQTLSYTIDIYRGKISATRDLIAFFAYVAFFPQLVAGPIERASHLLPQFFKKHIFNYDFAVSGIYLILWGLFKKVVIADNCADVVDKIFTNYQNLNSIDLFLGLFYFSFQIYGDFSGYSDIAIGTGRLLGFDLMTNFRTPYFSRNISEFWSRWHISLTTWFRDYLYIPLGGNRISKNRTIFNVIIVFVVSGLWHGANWTFIIWGLLNGILFIPLLLRGSSKRYVNWSNRHLIPSFYELLSILFTFILICITWLFFRATDISQALDYLMNIISFDISRPKYVDLTLLFLIGSLILIDWITREEGFDVTLISFKRKWHRQTIYIYIFLLIFFFGVFGKNEFIYFQF